MDLKKANERLKELGASSAFITTLGDIAPAALIYLAQLSEASRPFTFPVSNPHLTLALLWRLQKLGITPRDVHECITKLLDGNNEFL